MDSKEKWIADIVTACQTLDSDQVGFLRSMVCSTVN
jgi:hypothetical protein